MWSAEIITQIALLDGHATWLMSTVASLLVVTVLALFAAAILYAGRRFHWMSNAEQIRITRKLRVAFGGLFLLAATGPYVLQKAPLLVIAAAILGLVGVLPFVLSEPDSESAPSAEFDH